MWWVSSYVAKQSERENGKRQWEKKTRGRFCSIISADSSNWTFRVLLSWHFQNKPEHCQEYFSNIFLVWPFALHSLYISKASSKPLKCVCKANIQYSLMKRVSPKWALHPDANGVSLAFVLQGARVWLRHKEQLLPSIVSSCDDASLVLTTDYGKVRKLPSLSLLTLPRIHFKPASVCAVSAPWSISISHYICMTTPGARKQFLKPKPVQNSSHRT